MTATQRTHDGYRRNSGKHYGLYLLTLLIALMAFMPSLVAQQTAAGTPIGNQASATYTDSSSVSRTTTSNLVITTVAQVASFTLTPNGAKTGAPGAQVYYPHVLTNTGNGSDSFTLSAIVTAGAFTHTGVAIYADVNDDGIPDNFTNLAGTNVTVAAGAINAYHFLVVGTVPPSATGGQTGTMAFNAKSVFDNTLPAITNTDTTTATGNAVMNVTKAMSAIVGAAGSGPYTITLTYTNTGNATASAVTFTDALPANMNYAAGSGRWSVTGATVLTDAIGDIQGAGTTIDYSRTGSTITAIVNSIPAGVSGNITFQVNIAAAAVPGVLNNTATYSYNDSVGNVGPFNTNTVGFTVQQSVSLTFTDTGTVGTGDADNALNGVQLVASAPQGGTVTFTNIVTNTGNGTDTFNVAVANVSFPAGTTFQLFKTGGLVPLTDSNGDGIPDTGPIAAGATYNVVIIATLPGGVSGGGPYNATATATSTTVGAINAGANASATERLTTITANAVDMTNNSALPTVGGVAPGSGPGPEVGAVTTNSVAPGATTTFTLYVNNITVPADNYNLIASNTTIFGAGNTLPAGWTVVFHTSLGADCSAGNIGAVVTNTGNVSGVVANVPGNKLICAVASIPANFAAGTYGLYFRAISPNSGAKDDKHDAVTVTAVHSVSFTPNGAGQVFPGGSKVYPHTLTNNGNLSETFTFPAGFLTDSTAGWSSILYLDNGSIAGALDPTDTLVTVATTFMLAPGASQTFVVKVTSPPGSTAGNSDVTTLTATFNAGASSVAATDTTTVVNGQLQLNKLQALDAACNGTPGAFSVAPINSASAKPGACIAYQVTATNVGAGPITNVVVTDATPTNTTYITGGGVPAAATSIGVIVAPASGAAGNITATVGALNPAQAAVITFEVKIN